jgi:hypothetical protein
MTDDLLRITDEDDWLDLGEGEQGLVIGRVDAQRKDFIIINFSNWTSLTIEIDQEVEVKLSLLGLNVELVVERTEDGVITDAEHIIKARIRR